ncbi:MAG: helix-turn-helix domain-containing protein [Burkholderiaceae bacterium]
MDINQKSIEQLGQRLMNERKRQGLSREQAAAVCNVSASFIRDAEADPGRCSLARMAQLIQGLGLTLELSGLQPEEAAAKPRKAATQ